MSSFFGNLKLAHKFLLIALAAMAMAAIPATLAVRSAMAQWSFAQGELAGIEPSRSEEGWREDVIKPGLSHEDALAAAPHVEHGGFAYAASDCTGCHLPHAGRRAKLVREELHMPFGSADCQACHSPPGESPQLPKLKAGGLELCADCHDFKAVTRLANPHAPVKSGACFSCHAPHAGAGKAILRASGPALCRRCHDPRSTAESAAHAKAPRPLAECVKCHAPHAPRMAGARHR